MNALLTISETASELKVSKPTVRAMIERGELDAVALPTSGTRNIYRVPRHVLDNLIATHSLSKKKENPQ